MSEENKALMHRWFEEVWNKGRAEAIDEMFAEDAVAHGLGEAGMKVTGPAAFKPFLAHLRGAFPNIKVTVEETIAEGDRVAARWTARMTHQGDQLGIPASGKDVEVSGMSFIRIRQGKIVEGWNNWHVMSMMQQIESGHKEAKLLK